MKLREFLANRTVLNDVLVLVVAAAVVVGFFQWDIGRKNEAAYQQDRAARTEAGRQLQIAQEIATQEERLDYWRNEVLEAEKTIRFCYQLQASMGIGSNVMPEVPKLEASVAKLRLKIATVEQAVAVARQTASVR